MTPLSHFFNRKEFICNCGCSQDTIDYDLLLLLDSIRAYFDLPVTINSGNRCVEYNKKIGGSPNSQHLKSKAADIVVKGINPQLVYKYLNETFPDHYGIGNYKTFTHFDVRSTKARW